MLRIWKDNNNLNNPAARLHVLNRNAIRGFNKRDLFYGPDENHPTMQMFDATVQLPNIEDDIKRVYISPNAVAKMAFYPISSKRLSVRTFSIKKTTQANGRIDLNITDDDHTNNWGTSEESNNTDEQQRLGSNSVQAICHLGDGTLFLQGLDPFTAVKPDGRTSEKMNVLLEKETDTFTMTPEGDFDSAEIKCRGQLGMEKTRFFQKKMIELVAKAVISKKTSTVIVVRDDRVLNKECNNLVVTEVLFWDDVGRLVPKSFCDNIEAFYVHLKSRLISPAMENATSLEVTKDGVEFHLRSVDGVSSRYKPLKLKDERTMIPNDLTKKACGKVLPFYVVVGDGIPRFEYNMSSVFLRYKTQSKIWTIWDDYEHLVVLVENLIGLEKCISMHRPLEGKRFRKKAVNLQIFTIGGTDQEIERITEKMRRNDNVRMTHIKRYIDDNDLGRQLNEMGILLYPEPVPSMFLFLGEKPSVPLRLMISRLNFVTLQRAAAFDFTLPSEPKMIAAIGCPTNVSRHRKSPTLIFPKPPSRLLSWKWKMPPTCHRTSLPLPKRTLRMRCRSRDFQSTSTSSLRKICSLLDNRFVC